MELKPYQQQILDDISLYLDKVQETKDISSAFSLFWYKHPRTPLIPTLGAVIEPYKNNIKSVPHVCVKVPTAGGKTFIASTALKNIFDAFDSSNSQAVVWLVPSVTILEQTIKNLSDPCHPYRQKINTYFRNRVEVYDKSALLNGSNFNASTVKENLSIFVLSFDSFRTKNKEGHKVYQENGNLLSFGSEFPMDEDITLMRVIQSLNPVVVVDESHNAETELSVEMLQNLNPSFILDLTATPRNNSNIISFVDAFELKKENMVKLPVIVYNQHDKTEVITSAIKMLRKLEEEAQAEQKEGGKYIRPIALLQAQPKNKEDNTTFEKIKEILIKSGIPEEQIKIKTANINEIKGLDLMSTECEVRYIITINALKEGWDCPFAYILASLADKSSPVDVEQILGRILRQPYVMKHKSPLLNMSYVLTASSKFSQTLENIIKGLNKAGFSSKDYKVAEPEKTTDTGEQSVEPSLSDLFRSTEKQEPVDDNLEDVKIDVIANVVSGEAVNTEADTTIANITEVALKESADMEETLSIMAQANQKPVPADLSNLVNTITIKEDFAEEAKRIRIPQFYLDQKLDLFGGEDIPVSRNNLLDGFPLEKASTDINFASAVSEMYKVDLDASKKDSTPTYLKIDGKDRDILNAYLSAPTTTAKDKITTLTAMVKKNMGTMYPIPDQKIDAYLKRIFEQFDNDQYFAFLDNVYSYSQRIKKKINEEASLYARNQFHKLLDIDKIDLKPTYTFPESINLISSIDYLYKSLYEREGKVNEFEKGVINDVASMSNIRFWTRNLEHSGFRINGFINHYPDFIIVTTKGNIIILETKGDHLEAEEKIELGRLWESKAGKGYKYFLVYNDRNVEGAYRKEEFLDRIKEL